MNRNIEEHLQKLYQYLQEEKLAEALDYIETLSQEERTYWEIENITGVICSYCGQFKDAVSFFRRALDKNPDSSEIYYNLADAYFYLKEYQQAELMLNLCESVTDDEQLTGDILRMRLRIMELYENGTAEKKDNSVLMVAYYFPPLSGSGVFRSIKFAKYLPELGWNTTVISADEPPLGWNFRDDSQVKEIPKEVNVIRIKDEISTKSEISIAKEKANELIYLLKDILKNDKEALNIFGAVLASKQGISQLLTFPCSCLGWAWDVIKHIESSVDLSKVQVIYTTSGPASAHLVGFYLKKKYGVTWVADYRDAWTDNPYSEFDILNAGHRLLYCLEGILLKEADCNITIERSMVPMYISKFGLKKQQMAYITNGYDEADFKELNYCSKKTEKFTLCYSGLLYTKQRSIVPVLEALRQLKEEGKIDLNNVKIRIVGKGNEEANRITVDKYGLSGILEQTGYISHKEALQVNLDADLLLLLVGDEEKFKPVYTGKIFDYLRSGKPVLALAPKGGAVDELLDSTGHGKTFFSTQVSEMKDMIYEEYQKWAARDINEYKTSPLIKVHERRYLTMKLADIFYKVKKPAGDVNYSIENKKRYLVICTGGYPTDIGKKTNTNMFAHKRILKYIEAGLDVNVFGFTWSDTAYKYTYQGVDVVCGGERQLIDILVNNHYEKLLIHFPDPSVFNAIAKAGKLHMPMLAWCHGHEVLSWSKDIPYGYSNEQIEKNKAAWDVQDRLKKDFLKSVFQYDNICFIFVSEWMKNRAGKFVGCFPKHAEIIHNFIDCEFYESSSKVLSDTMKICAVKSHATRKYANDITAKAILELSKKEYFAKLEFELYGDGVLFEENFGELVKNNFSNVHIKKTFLSAEEMKECFEKNHIFLSPTRLDAQGVTASEAMSAGLVVISTNIAAIPEFIDESCGSLVEYDNYMQIVEEVEYLLYHPDEYLKKSGNAVQKVRKQCGYEATIEKEIQLIIR